VPDVGRLVVVEIDGDDSRSGAMPSHFLSVRNSQAQWIASRLK
jgi:hypothetical protein